MKNCKVLSSENLIELNKLYNNNRNVESSIVINSETYSILYPIQFKIVLNIKTLDAYN